MFTRVFSAGSNAFDSLSPAASGLVVELAFMRALDCGEVHTFDERIRIYETERAETNDHANPMTGLDAGLGGGCCGLP